MSGVHLASVGAQDARITGSPQYTYFLSTFKRHTNFSMQTHHAPFASTAVDFGDTAMCTIPRFGDLIRNAYFKFTLPALGDDLGYTDSVGHALIERADLLIGGQTVATLTGEFMEMWTDLSTSMVQRDSIKTMVGKTGTRTGLGPASASRTFIVPLPFYFAADASYAIPLVALRHQEVEIRLKLRDLGELVVGTGDVEASSGRTEKLINASLLVDYVFLEERERKIFGSSRLEYLITQTQVVSAAILSDADVFRLEFVNPVKELFFVVQDDSVLTGNDWFNFATSGGTDQLVDLSLELNGHVRIDAAVADALYLGTVQPMGFHTKKPDRKFYVYSFAIDPESPTPSGQLNMSRIQNAILRVSLAESGTKTLRVYATNYNILVVQNGLAGVLYNFT